MIGNERRVRTEQYFYIFSFTISALLLMGEGPPLFIADFPQ